MKQRVTIIAFFSSLSLIFGGVASLAGAGAGALVVGSLIWIDLSLESFTNGRTRKHDGN